MRYTRNWTPPVGQSSLPSTGPTTPPMGPPPPTSIASIQFPLHQVFLFFDDSRRSHSQHAPRGRRSHSSLGVITGTPIGIPSTSANGTNSTAFGDIPGLLYIRVVSRAAARLSRNYTAFEHTLPVCTPPNIPLSLYTLSRSLCVQP
jgi:hypothetical protein